METKPTSEKQNGVHFISKIETNLNSICLQWTSF